MNYFSRQHHHQLLSHGIASHRITINLRQSGYLRSGRASESNPYLRLLSIAVTMATQTAAPQARSLYRAILRELPRRSASYRSPLQSRFREVISSAQGDSALLRRQFEEMKQFTQYAKAQRVYTTLLERYNPGADMSETERVRLTARRVGMDLPIEALPDGNSSEKL